MVMARSYDGHEWELTRQTDAIALLGCDAAGCDATVPSDANSYVVDAQPDAFHLCVLSLLARDQGPP